MEGNKISVGLDIGTTKIACLVGRKTEHGKIEILGMGKSPSLGVTRGVVANIEKTVQSIKAAVAEAEAKSGKLDMGGLGSALHIYYGSETKYDPTTSKVQDAQYRYVVYMPWATAESTGLPERPIAPNHPWIMNPGTHRAHIMISPLPKDNK